MRFKLDERPTAKKQPPSDGRIICEPAGARRSRASALRCGMLVRSSGDTSCNSTVAKGGSEVSSAVADRRPLCWLSPPSIVVIVRLSINPSHHKVIHYRVRLSCPRACCCQLLPTLSVRPSPNVGPIDLPDDRRDRPGRKSGKKFVHTSDEDVRPPPRRVYILEFGSVASRQATARQEFT